MNIPPNRMSMGHPLERMLPSRRLIELDRLSIVRALVAKKRNNALVAMPNATADASGITTSPAKSMRSDQSQGISQDSPV
jgi:hypothetical protein